MYTYPFVEVYLLIDLYIWYYFLPPYGIVRDKIIQKDTIGSTKS